MTTTTESKALQDVLAERQRQDAKWGGPEHDDCHGWLDWYRFCSVRLGRLTLHARTGREQIVRRLFVEIAALAIAAVESIDRKTGGGAL